MGGRASTYYYIYFSNFFIFLKLLFKSTTSQEGGNFNSNTEINAANNAETNNALNKSRANTPTFASNNGSNNEFQDDVNKPFDKAIIDQILHSLVRIIVASHETVIN